jgi:hypothetical protein
MLGSEKHPDFQQKGESPEVGSYRQLGIAVVAAIVEEGCLKVLRAPVIQKLKHIFAGFLTRYIE